MSILLISPVNKADLKSDDFEGYFVGLSTSFPQNGECGIVGWGVVSVLEGFAVSTQPDAWLGMQTQSPYKALSDLQVDYYKA